uniref:KCNMB2 ball/chain domain-containing protein n=1 Tax=Anas zonorhyncha TaxID=75864 RepID=A0A8B9ZQC6_9AVES
MSLCLKYPRDKWRNIYQKIRDHDLLDKRKTVTALKAGEDRAILLGLAMMVCSIMMYFLLGITLLRSYMQSVWTEEAQCSLLNASITESFNCSFSCGPDCWKISQYPCLQVYVNLTSSGQKLLLYHNEETMKINSEVGAQNEISSKVGFCRAARSVIPFPAVKRYNASSSCFPGKHRAEKAEIRAQTEHSTSHMGWWSQGGRRIGTASFLQGQTRRQREVRALCLAADVAPSAFLVTNPEPWQSLLRSAVLLGPWHSTHPCRRCKDAESLQRRDCQEKRHSIKIKDRLRSQPIFLAQFPRFQTLKQKHISQKNSFLCFNNHETQRDSAQVGRRQLPPGGCGEGSGCTAGIPPATKARLAGCPLPTTPSLPLQHLGTEGCRLQ